MTQLSISPSSVLSVLTAYPRCLIAESIEFLRAARRYYPNRRFLRTELLCQLAYWSRSPEAICRRYLRDAPEDEVQKIYGETFLTTLEQIADAAEVSADDVVYELGCGRGRGVFWFNTVRGCRSVGVDINRYFIIQARRIQRKAEIEGVDFVLGNVIDIDYGDADFIYLYGTAFSDRAIVRLVRRFESLRSGTRVATVSYPLNAYTRTPLFKLEKTIKAAYPWGETEVYIQRRL